MQRIGIGDLGEGLRVRNSTVELVCALDFGPRIVRYRYRGGSNVLGDAPDSVVTTPLGAWRPRAGHRLWAAPERLPGSYAPDDDPVDAEILGERAVRIAQWKDATGLEKEMEISLASSGSAVSVRHRMTNRNAWSVEIAPWALTIMRPGGAAVIPSEPFRSHDESLLPVRPLGLWSFTDLSDPRWAFAPRALVLRPDPARKTPQKAGAGNTLGWCACVWEREVFVKRFDWDAEARYPDFGCNNEVYAEGDFLELETLGPLRLLAPDETAEHTERWFLSPRNGAGIPTAEDVSEAAEAAAALDL
ncbi:MAG: hypothetical protein M3167_10200 [Acidobacteriota bacterium]|nr:hypothetical protein [Acidobacteriota bacterium]